MKEDIKPRYEIIFSDLKNHMIGDYLISREFKMIMSQNGYYESWQNTYEQIREDRSYFFSEMDHDRGDNIKTLSVILNAAHENVEIEDLVTLIIVSFIENKKTNEDFSDIIEAMVVARFSENAINEVKNAFEKHKKLNLPQKLITKSNPPKTTSNSKVNKKDVFIVHGHDEAAKTKTARFIEKLGFKPIILHEQASGSKTVIEKIEAYSNVGFGIVLYTPCDIGAKDESNPTYKKRARQNVVFEHGFLIGKIGRENVCALVKGEVETPNDISGVVYVKMDEDEAWHLKIARELRNSGYDIDMNRL